jgi:hypothetical protein
MAACPCPIRILFGVDCAWTGTLSDIPVHINFEHCSQTAEVEGNFKVKLQDLSRGSRYHQMVLSRGELFYLTWEKDDNAFSFAVFHFGPKEETEALKYGIKIGNSAEYVAVTRKCHSYLEGGLKDLQPGNCVTLHDSTILNCLNCLSESKELSCEIFIGRGNFVGFVWEKVHEYLQVFSVIPSGICD